MKMSLRLKLTALMVLLVLVGLGAMGYFSYTKAKELVLGQAEQTLLIQAKTYAEHVDRQVD